MVTYVIYARNMTTFTSELEAAIADQIQVIARRSDPRITQGDMAKAAGVGREAMNNYLTGKRAMPLPVLLNVCELLGVDLNDLATRAYAQLGRPAQ